MTPEQWRFTSEVFAAIFAGLGLIFIGFVWRFFMAVSEIPRMRKGMRDIFEFKRKTEDKLKQTEEKLKEIEDGQQNVSGTLRRKRRSISGRIL